MVFDGLSVPTIRIAQKLWKLQQKLSRSVPEPLSPISPPILHSNLFYYIMLYILLVRMHFFFSQEQHARNLPKPTETFQNLLKPEETSPKTPQTFPKASPQIKFFDGSCRLFVRVSWTFWPRWIFCSVFFRGSSLDQILGF